MMPQIGQYDVVHHGKVCVNKAAAVIQNAYVQHQGIPELRLRREILFNSLGNHVEDEANVADSPLHCRSGSLKKFPRPMTLLFQSTSSCGIIHVIYGGGKEGGSPLPLLTL